MYKIFSVREKTVAHLAEKTKAKTQLNSNSYKIFSWAKGFKKENQDSTVQKHDKPELADANNVHHTPKRYTLGILKSLWEGNVSTLYFTTNETIGYNIR